MAGERARETVERLQQRSAELRSQIADKEQQKARLSNEIGEERREVAREAVAAASPGNESMDAASVVESQREISQHNDRITQLNNEITELTRQADKLDHDSTTLVGLAESAEAAEGQANDAADRALTEL